MVDFIVTLILVDKWKDKKLVKTSNIWIMELSGFPTFLTAICSKKCTCQKKKMHMSPSISELIFYIYTTYHHI